MKRFALEPFYPKKISPDYCRDNRRFQGIPSIEILPSGRIFACWYCGIECGEGPGNYVVLATSNDKGLSWNEIQVILPIRPEIERAYDSIVWLDPKGRLWWLWTQGTSEKLWDVFDGRAGVWAAIAENPDSDFPQWSMPQRIAEGIEMNKPIVLRDGSWAFPTALWSFYKDKLLPEFSHMYRSNVTISSDCGETFELCIGPNIPNCVCDEHVLVEKKDGTLWLAARTQFGIAESFSTDSAKTWSAVHQSDLGGPNSRFQIMRLKSGRLLLVNHQVPHTPPGDTYSHRREKLTAWLSDDDGETWYGKLMIDERIDVSYPDVSEADDGFLYVIYDRTRLEYGEILLARFREDDVRAGSFQTPGSYSRLLVSSLCRK